MGVEMFDVGASVEVSRNRLVHYCQGFSRAMPAEHETQRTESSLELSHTHAVEIPAADVESPLPRGRTYETSRELEHLHTVRLSSGDFELLRAGETVLLESSTSLDPEPHTHIFRLVDQLGLWGSPALVTSGAWPQPSTQPNGMRGRTSIEIYNMPDAMARAGLFPRPGISVALYLYVAALREDPAAGVRYPQTADRQPTFILAKGAPEEPSFSRGFCGFEPYLLDRDSHVALTRFLLLRQFQLGTDAN
jgi:hypothetical protein